MSEVDDLREKLRDALFRIGELEYALAHAEKVSGKFEDIVWRNAFKVGSRVRWVAAALKHRRLSDRLGTVTRIDDCLHVRFDGEKGGGQFDAHWFRAYPGGIVLEPENEASRQEGS